MSRRVTTLMLSGALIALLPGIASAVTRDLAELQPARLTFGQSILNQLSHDTYRDPYDELQTRPYNLLFNNIGRHTNLSPWQGQEGSYTRYFNALIGNNGAANVDNNADSIQGSLIRRETGWLAWGVSGALLNGNDRSNDSNVTSTFNDTNDLNGYDVRAAASAQISQSHVIGAGVSVTRASREITDSSFEEGVGGFIGSETFDQSWLSADVGLRWFFGGRSSWEARVILGDGSATQSEFSEDLDDTGAMTDRFVVTNYDISDTSLGFETGYNRLRSKTLGETEFRIGIQSSQRELDNDDLSYSQADGETTPGLMLLDQETLTTTEAYVSAKLVFQAGETEIFTGARLGQRSMAGATEIDAAGTIVREEVDDSQNHIGLTVGLRQPLLRDRLRFIVSGHADLVDQEYVTAFDTSLDRDDSSLTTAQYAIGLEGVLANVTFDIAWLLGEEAPVVPVAIGLPEGSRRTVELDRLVFSSAVAW